METDEHVVGHVEYRESKRDVESLRYRIPGPVGESLILGSMQF